MEQALYSSGWQILNSTPLPVVCFRIAELPPEQDEPVRSVTAQLHHISQFRITTTRGTDGNLLFRAAFTSSESQPTDVDELVKQLNVIRKNYLRREHVQGNVSECY